MVKFENALVLLLIPCCLAYVMYIGKRLRGLSRFNKNLFAVIRGLVAVLLIFGLSGVKIQKDSNVTTTIFAVDLSASMKNTIDKIQNFIVDAVKTAGLNDQAAVVLFGERAAIAAAPQTASQLEGLDFDTRVNGEYTNISEALRLSQSLIPEDSKKRIVIISDGLENTGDAIASAKLLNQKNIIIDTVYVHADIGVETQLNQIKVPDVIRKGVRNDIEISGYSNSENSGRLLIYRNNILIYDETVSIRLGENKFLFSESITDDEQSSAFGGVIYRAELLPAIDAFSGNNSVYAYAYVEDTLNILASGINDSEKEIVKILQASGVNIDVRAPSELDMTQEELNIYDAVILANISVDDMPEGFPNVLDGYVKNFGGGLIVSGGDNSFGLGDYYKTPLETMLPVDMKIKEEENSPDIGMIIVLDRSGSMTSGNYGVSKLELAKEAVIRSVDQLSDDDSLGILAFDDKFIWASNYRSIKGNREIFKNDIANITPGGGTSILPALTQSCLVMEQANAKIKHIILLTDGQAERYGYNSVINSMRNSGITLSTIAVGSDSDTVLLEELARQGGGRYYFTNEFTDLPKIFTKETNIAGKNYLNNEVFTPVIGAISPILNDIDALPALGGYISTTLKPRADAVLLSRNNEPVLASWQYGLGRAVAWTSDMDGGWSGDWIKFEESVSVFRNMVSWIAKDRTGSDLQMSVTALSGETHFTLILPYGEEVENVSGMVFDENMEQREISFKAVAPGRYLGISEGSAQGVYIANITFSSEEESVTYSRGYSLSYSEELDIRGIESGETKLARIADITGGRILNTLSNIFEPINVRVYTENNISDLLIVLSLLLFLLDVFLRRFPAFTRIFEKAVYYVFKRSRNPKNESDDFSSKARVKVKIEIPKASDKPASEKHRTSDALILQKKKRSIK